MVDVSVVDASTMLLGTPVAMAAGIAPTALHGLGHPEAEVATAAASESGALFVSSPFGPGATALDAFP
jgi:isopentenyl diphosphate isomerase/L-lactate dehydrogenase-like FMN-dependent dehydrogenase